MSASQQKKQRQLQREQGTEKKQVAQQQAEKKQKTTKVRNTIICIVLALAIIAVVVFNSSLLYRNFSAVTIGDEGYSAAELSFFYKSGYYNFVNQNGSYLQYFGLDTSKPLSSQSYGEGQTWADFFRDSAISTMTEVTMLYEEAQKAGFELSAQDKAAMDAELNSLETTYKDAGFSSANAYLAASFGKGCNVKLVSELIEKTYIAQGYAKSVNDSFTYTSDELVAHYSENKDSYDNYTYLSYFVDGSVPEQTDGTNTEASSTDIEAGNDSAEATVDSEAAMANAKELAESILEDVQTQDDFKKKVLAVTQTEVNEATTQGSSLSSSYSEWMTDSSRAEGDTTIIDTDTGYYVLYFISRDGNDFNTVSARHILTYVLPDENSEYTDEAKAEAKKTSEDILAEWKSGEATEESFAELANKYSDDTGSNTNGGLYENFKPGSMVKEFNDWCFDESRKPGDTTIVYNEGSYTGFHIIYFVGEGEIYRDVISENALRSKDYSDWKTAALENYTAKQGFTAKLVK